VGDIILTEKDCHEGLEVYVEGRPMFLASAGVLKGHKAVQIGGRIRLPQHVVNEQLAELEKAKSQKDHKQANEPVPANAADSEAGR